MLKFIDKKEVYMKVSSISKSSNLSCKARFKCNGEALEQLGKKKVSELEKTCKKIGTNRDFILVGSKSIMYNVCDAQNPLMSGLDVGFAFDENGKLIQVFVRKSPWAFY